MFSNEWLSVKRFVTTFSTDSIVPIFADFFLCSHIHTSDCRDFPRERWMSHIYHRAPARRYDWSRWREAKNTSTSHSKEHKRYSRAYLLWELRLWRNIFPLTVNACIPPALWSHFAKTKILNIFYVCCWNDTVDISRRSKILGKRSLRRVVNINNYVTNDRTCWRCDLSLMENDSISFKTDLKSGKKVSDFLRNFCETISMYTWA